MGSSDDHVGQKAASEATRDQASLSPSSSAPSAVDEKAASKRPGSPGKSSSSDDKDAALAHLPEDEKQILKKQLDSPSVSGTFFGLYRYADVWDYLILLVSGICAIAGGAALPMFTVRKTPRTLGPDLWTNSLGPDSPW